MLRSSSHLLASLACSGCPFCLVDVAGFQLETSLAQRSSWCVIFWSFLFSFFRPSFPHPFRTAAQPRELVHWLWPAGWEFGSFDQGKERYVRRNCPRFRRKRPLGDPNGRGQEKLLRLSCLLGHHNRSIDEHASVSPVCLDTHCAGKRFANC